MKMSPFDDWADRVTQILRNEYPELQESWNLYLRSDKLLKKYAKQHDEMMLLSCSIWHWKIVRRYRIKMKYLSKLNNERFNNYLFLEKLLRDY